MLGLVGSPRTSLSTYPHRSMKSPSDLIILFQSRTASKNLWQPKLTNCSLHVSDLSLRRCRCLDPLGRLSSDTTYHVGMSEGLWRPLLGFDGQCGRNWLCDAGVQRRCSAWDDKVGVALIASAWTTLAVAGPRSDKRRVVIK